MHETIQIGHDLWKKWGERGLVKVRFLVKSGVGYNGVCYIGAGLGSRVWGLGSRVSGVGCRVWETGIRE